VSAARRANRRRSGAADFLFPLAIEAFDDVGALAFPQPPKPLHQGSGSGGSLCPRLRLRSLRYNWGASRSSRYKMSAALSAHRALGGGILMLFKAAMWTFHTDFNRRRLCHGLAKKGLPMPVPRTLPSLPAPVDELRPDACALPWRPGNCPQARYRW